MKYTQQEKLKIMMLSDIFRALNIKNSFDPDLIDEAISTDNYWALSWQYPSLSCEDNNTDDVQLFVDTVDMFDILQYTYQRFNEEDRADVEASIPYFNATHSLVFPGFDGNNETNFLTIGGLLKRMGRFSARDDLTRNSHMPSVDIYRRMLAVFLPARSQSYIHDVGISKEAFINTLIERTHPESR